MSVRMYLLKDQNLEQYDSPTANLSNDSWLQNETFFTRSNDDNFDFARIDRECFYQAYATEQFDPSRPADEIEVLNAIHQD